MQKAAVNPCEGFGNELIFIVPGIINRPAEQRIAAVLGDGYEELLTARTKRSLVKGLTGVSHERLL
jgi:hypothetical protein